MKDVGFHLLVKVGDVSGVAPRLVSFLLTNSLRKPRTPTKAWEGLVDAITCDFVDDVAKAMDTFVLANIVVQGGELNQLSHEGDSTIDTHIFMTDDGFSYSLGLIIGGSENLQDFHSLDTTVDVEGHSGRGEIFLGSTDIVEQAGERPSYGRELCGVLGKELLADHISWSDVQYSPVSPNDRRTYPSRKLSSSG